MSLKPQHQQHAIIQQSVSCNCKFDVEFLCTIRPIGNVWRLVFRLGHQDFLYTTLIWKFKLSQCRVLEITKFILSDIEIDVDINLCNMCAVLKIQLIRLSSSMGPSAYWRVKTTIGLTLIGVMLRRSFDKNSVSTLFREVDSSKSCYLMILLIIEKYIYLPSDSLNVLTIFMQKVNLNVK